MQDNTEHIDTSEKLEDFKSIDLIADYWTAFKITAKGLLLSIFLLSMYQWTFLDHFSDIIMLLCISSVFCYKVCYPSKSQFFKFSSTHNISAEFLFNIDLLRLFSFQTYIYKLWLILYLIFFSIRLFLDSINAYPYFSNTIFQFSDA